MTDERGRTAERGKTRPRARAVLGLVAGVVLALAGPPACSSEDAPAVPTRACGLAIWHKPPSRDAHVEIVGDWNDWQRPGLLPAVRGDGWVSVAVDAAPGEHGYAIIEDGVWLLDDHVPMSAFHEGREVSVAVAEDCAQPSLAIAGVAATADGHATVQASFLASRSGSPVDPTTVTAVAKDGETLSVTAADPARGTVQLEGAGLKRGKYTFSVQARSKDGALTEPAIATVWVEPHAWDPRDAIVYQVMIDRFRGDAGALAAPASPSARAGGTLAGVRHAIEAGEIEALGVNTLWLSPLYQNPEGEFPGTDGREYTSYHGYWPAQSRALDPRFASDEELDRFMKVAHDRGLRVLFDVVPNHVHQEHPWVTEHPDWFNQDRTCICGQGSCDWATHIRTCWFAPYLPDLDWTNSDVARAATGEVLWWFDRWGADGLRIDAVPMMPRAATRRIARTVRAKYEHPGNVPYILGENFTGPGAYENLRYDLGPFGLDGSFHFPLMWTLRSTVADEVAPMGDIDTSFRAGEKAWDGSGAVMGMMIGNHDVSRFASVSAGSATGDAWSPAPQPVDPVVYAKQRVALAAVLTLPGAPVVYYGDEVGLAGRSDPDSRRVMPSDEALLPAQRETRDVVRRVGRARACSDALRRGTLRTIAKGAERYVFAREIDGDPASTVLVSLGRRPTVDAEVTLPPGAPTALVDVVTGAPASVAGGVLTLPSDAFGVHVLVAASSPCAGTP
ncbi:MAG: Neopullulanase [Labilithrix sp.]|nr:Neopullulanase [Labilithrix sp.]